MNASIRGNSLYTGSMEERLKFGVFKPLLAAGIIRAYAKRRTILFQGEIPRSVMVVQSGIVKVYGITTSGDQRTVTLLSAGDIFSVEWVFDRSRVSLYYYEAITDCSILSVAKAEFLSTLDSNAALKDHIFLAYMAHYTSATMH